MDPSFLSAKLSQMVEVLIFILRTLTAIFKWASCICTHIDAIPLG